MARKTISVVLLIKACNGWLERGLTQLEKKAICTTLEYWLHATGNYKGFSYQFNWNTATEDIRTSREYDRFYHINSKLMR